MVAVVCEGGNGLETKNFPEVVINAIQGQQGLHWVEGSSYPSSVTSLGQQTQKEAVPSYGRGAQAD